MAGETMLLEVWKDGADARELDEATRRLFDDLDFVKGVDVAQRREAAPPNTKAVDAAVFNQLLLSIVGSGGVTVVLVGVLKDWMLRHNGFKVRIKKADGAELEISGATPAQLESLLERLEPRSLDTTKR